jgi:phosphoglycolate phosphatase-like HAD superfamily hydrolase
MIKAVIFDFDGVIVESAGIKTSAFRKLFEQNNPEKVDAIVDYHVRNMGVSRFVKFRYIYENILKLPLTVTEEEELGRKFSNIVFEEIIKAPFVGGAEDFIVRNQKKYMMFVASGTPDEELRDILKRRKISNLFKEIHGTPEFKSDIIKGILKRHSLRKEKVVFVGDAESDLRASEETGVYFIARVLPDNSQSIKGCKWKIHDLTKLDAVINEIATSRSYTKLSSG